MRVCKKCVFQFGFWLSDKSKTFETDEELYEHTENVARIFYVRIGTLPLLQVICLFQSSPL